MLGNKKNTIVKHSPSNDVVLIILLVKRLASSLFSWYSGTYTVAIELPMHANIVFGRVNAVINASVIYPAP